MPHLLSIGFKRALTADEIAAFPFAVPAIRSLPTLDLTVPVTLFVGENGSGKSTLLEGIAAAAELPSLGVSEIDMDATLSQQQRLGAALRLIWSPRSRQGFFLRAEDFFGHLRMQARTDARMAREAAEFRGAHYDHMAASEGGSHVDEANAARFLSKYDSRSHGESFVDIFSTRIHPRGLYLLDEPEAPLSPMKQFLLLRLILRAAADGAQFVIATHSPILLACPGARIFSFDSTPICEALYEDLEHVTVMRSFLNDPKDYLRRVGETDVSEQSHTSTGNREPAQDSLTQLEIFLKEGRVVHAHDLAWALITEDEEHIAVVAKLYAASAIDWAEPYPAASREAIERSETSHQRIPLADLLLEAAEKLEKNGDSEASLDYAIAAAVLFAQFALNSGSRMYALHRIWWSALKSDPALSVRAASTVIALSVGTVSVGAL